MFKKDSIDSFFQISKHVKKIIDFFRTWCLSRLRHACFMRAVIHNAPTRERWVLPLRTQVLLQRTSCCLRTFFVPTTSTLDTHSSALALLLTLNLYARLRAFACRLSMCRSFPFVEASKNGRKQTIVEFWRLQSFASFCSIVN